MFLDHERLDVYQCALELLRLSLDLLPILARKRPPLADQLQRATEGIPLCIAEGAGKTSERDRARFHAMARGSAMECAAILDVVRLLNICDPARVTQGKELTVRIVAMLSKMCR